MQTQVLNQTCVCCMSFQENYAYGTFVAKGRLACNDTVSPALLAQAFRHFLPLALTPLSMHQVQGAHDRSGMLSSRLGRGPAESL